MTKDAIRQLIYDALMMVNQSRDGNDKIPIGPETNLFGSNGHLDSMGLVALLIDIEELLQSEGIHLSLGDERAMSEKSSPFRDVPTLTDYIFVLVGNAQDNVGA